MRIGLVFIALLVIVPLSLAHASILSFVQSTFSAEIADAQGVQNKESNSQNVAILDANLSPNLENKEENSIQTVDDTAIATDGNPTSTDGTDETSDSTFEDISIYVVHPGDTISEISKMYDVSVKTIELTNNLPHGKALTPGDTLIILPVDGLQYKVAKGDTVVGIAKKYKANAQDIRDFNLITDDTAIALGDEIIIPGAKELVVPVKPKEKKTRANLPGSLATGSSVDSSGYFIPPVVCPITQTLHDKYGFDIGCPKGTPIHAAAGGTVKFSKSHSWNGGYGWLVIIQHENGMLTFYAHQSKIIVSVGDHVTQGQTIGYVGSTGHSTGPHLHFEVRGGKNPYQGHKKGQVVSSF